MADLYEQKRLALINYLQEAGFLRTKSIIDAFKGAPRHLFVPDAYLNYAYEDIALPIMKESTISQPSTVAYMLERLAPQKGEKVLEIGTGSGWQACLIAQCVGAMGKVITLEIDPDVAGFAKKNIGKTKFKNITTVLADGSLGYPDEAPYNKIIYTAATPDVPKQMLLQLKINGRIVAPVGTRFMQALKMIDRISEKEVEESQEASFQFVPLKGALGF